MRVQTFTKLWKENKGFIVFLLLLMVFRSSWADWNRVPTGSMRPTIIEGDMIVVDKLAYDVRLPFIQTKLIHLADPVRGEIVVFESEKSKTRLIKRVIGIPGDIIELRDNKVLLNGKLLDYQAVLQPLPYSKSGDMIEQLGNIHHVVRTSEGMAINKDFPPIRVPEGQYLVLGDNRNNSADSRMIGFVPREEIIGRSNTIALSLNREKYWLPRSDRFFKSMNINGHKELH